MGAIVTVIANNAKQLSAVEISGFRPVASICAIRNLYGYHQQADKYKINIIAILE